MWSDHLTILPIVLPLVAGASLLLIEERRHRLKAFINAASTAALLATAILLLRFADAGAGMATYRLGDWPAPFGIVLVIDRLSALMLLLIALLAVSALVFSLARWHKAGAHFHSLFQFLLMGVNGAFLTGDLFNLFVFFEVLLAASYGLALYGSGVARVKAGLHYIAINLAGSSLLLIGISLIYGVTGSLNMADLAIRIAALAGSEEALAEAGAAVLGVAFLLKAGIWPLGFWLPTTYAAASAPVAALFAIMSKVGIYAILRLWLLVFGPNSAAATQFGASWLSIGGMVTIVFGMIGVLASQGTNRLAGYSVLISSGTLLAVIGTGNGAAVSGALFYLVSSTLAIGAFFLLIELVERGRDPFADVIAVTMEAFGGEGELDPKEEETGVAIPATLAILGIAFVGCALVLAGLPPLSGFLAKFAILTTLLNPEGLGTAAPISGETWALVALIIAAGLATLIAMTRAGIRTLWVEREVPRVRVAEALPVLFLLLLSFAMTLRGETVIRYMDETAGFLERPRLYIEGVLSAKADGARNAAFEVDGGPL